MNPEKIDILVDIKMQIGEQKIDLTVVKSAGKATDPLAVKALKTQLVYKLHRRIQWVMKALSCNR